MKINKIFLQFIAALWILVFHLWINETSLELEQFIIKKGYVGVDIFFFVSAYSLAGKKIDYRSFLKNRLITIYCPFMIFTIIAAIYKNWPLIKWIKTALFISFFEKGGGSFLWFIPAIMLFYLIYPLFLISDNRHKIFLVLVSWLFCTLLFENVLGYSEIFIFTNRIPVMLAGYLLKKHPMNNWLFLGCLPIGIFLLTIRFPYADLFYLLDIPFVIGLAWVSGFINDTKILRIIAGSSLEIYAIQMIFGVQLVNVIWDNTQNKTLTNVLALSSVIIVSVILHSLGIKIKTIIKGIK